MAEYKVTFVVISELEPTLVHRALSAGLNQSGLMELLHIERLAIGPPMEKHRPQLRRVEGGALEFRMVERPIE